MHLAKERPLRMPLIERPGAVVGLPTFLDAFAKADRVGHDARHPPFDQFHREGHLRIAGHAADIAKKIPGAAEADRQMSIARKAQDWDSQIHLAIHPKTAEKIRKTSPPSESGTCTMCGEFCAISIVKKFFGQE